MFIYTEQDIRKADQYAHKNGLSVNALMETAGRSLFEEVKKLVRQNESILILSGRGNNGGDGIVLARYLKQNGYQVDLVLPFGEPKTNTSLEHFQFYKANGFSYSLKINKQKKYDCIIDALLGVGTKLPLSEEYNEVVRWCNDYDALKIAVDLPTGVMADTGDVGEAFQADYTFSLHGVKPSTFFTPANRFFGRIRALDIGIPHKSNWRTWTKEDCLNTLERRKIDAHKGTFGTGLLLAATNEMPGSAILAALGAMRMGIGKLMVGTTQYAASVIASVVPEATYWFNGLEKVANGEVPEGIKACAVGPGLTDEKLVDHALATLWDQDLPIILDAGALKERQLPKRKAPVIITPHPGEFSRLTGLSTKEIQKIVSS